MLVSCKQYTPDNLPAERLRFGSKGGITGGAREYVLLLENGRLLFDDELTGKLDNLGKLTKEELQAVRADLRDINFAKTGNAPGNFNTSLQYYHAGTVDKMSWSQPGGAPTTTVKDCYTGLMAAVRRIRKTE